MNQTAEKVCETRVNELSEDIVELLKDASIDFSEKLLAVEQAHNNIVGLIITYNASLLGSLLKQWEKKNLAWCEKCENVVDADEVSLVFIHGVKVCGSWKSEYEPFEMVMQTCAQCRQIMLLKNGTYGNWNTSAEAQESFFAKKVDADDTGVKSLSFRKFPEVMSDEFILEWNIPPEIACDKGTLHVEGTSTPAFMTIPGWEML